MMRTCKLALGSALALVLSLGSAGGVSGETLLERGAYLVKGIAGCGNCHTPKIRGNPDNSREMAGGNVFDEKPFTAYAANLTPDKDTGIGSWTDAQIIRAIRRGKRPDGSTIGPPMPVGVYRGLSDRDVKAIVAYLRSLKPVKNKVPKSVYRIPLPKAYGPPVTTVAEVPRSDKVAYGKYLVGPVGHCVVCHTPMIKGRRDFKNQFLAGGFRFDGPWGASFSANITPHPEAGIGKWSDRQIKTAISTGLRANGDKMLPPMGYFYYKNISREDLDAIVVYLRSLKPNGKMRKVRHIPPKKK